MVKPFVKVGKTHADTFSCDDYSKILKDFKESMPIINHIDFYTDGNNIFGYEVVYKHC